MNNGQEDVSCKDLGRGAIKELREKCCATRSHYNPPLIYQYGLMILLPNFHCWLVWEKWKMASLSIVTYSMHFYSAQKKAKFIDEHPRKLSDRSKVHLSFFQLFLLIFLQLFCYMTSYTYSKNSFFQQSILHILSYPFSLNYRTFEPNRAQSISFFFLLKGLPSLIIPYTDIQTTWRYRNCDENRSWKRRIGERTTKKIKLCKDKICKKETGRKEWACISKLVAV